MSAGFDYKDLDEATVTAGADTSKRPIRYLPFTLQYTGGAVDDGGNWQFGLSTTLGLRGLLRRKVDCDGVRVDQFECKRTGADGNFAVLRGEIERTQKLGAGLTLNAHVDGQLATQPLISNEQYSVGGFESVNGYLESEQSGDSGFRLRSELRTPNLTARLSDSIDLSALAFFHWAQVRLQQPLPAQVARFTLGSTGLGLRLVAYKGFKARADIARVQHTASHTLNGSTRFHLGLSYEF
jgi:hemolysin activation/secretion protein